MKSGSRRCSLAFAGALGLLALPLGSFAQQPGKDVFDVRGNVIRTKQPQGAGREVPPGATPNGPAGIPLRGDGPSGTAAECQTIPKPSLVFRASSGDDDSVDPCGRVHHPDGSTSIGRPSNARTAVPVTIDWMTTRPTSSSTYTPGGTIPLLGSAVTYHLSDGTQWTSGAGNYYNHWSQLVRVEVDGSTIRYVLSPPEVGAVYEQTDYDNGDHSSQGRLMAAGPLVIEAQAGSTVAVLHGLARVAANDPTSYGEPRFNYFTAVVGSVVPFEIDYTILGSTWQPETFSQSFTFSATGSVDFAHPVSIPRALEISIVGPSRIHGNFTTSYLANVRFDSGVTRNMTSGAAWSVDHPEVASIVGGVLVVGALSTPQETLAVGATLTWGPDTLVAQKSVVCLAVDPAERTGSWPMFQANAAHTGYLPVTLRPETFHFRWKKTLGTGLALNPVAAGEGKVFATTLVYFVDAPQLFALRSSDGATLWSKGFGSVFSVNPPSFAYGNVYVQTGNHSTDTWLHALDGASGDTVFQAPHEAQWERYYAPTVYAGKAYVNGGYYGGMYGFDAYTGARLWFSSLQQYDQWTPAVEEVRAFSYQGEYYPGLYVKDRVTGVPGEFFVGDPSFEWSGWSMNGAPVIGAHGDVIAIHDGRLIAFDPGHGVIAWELQSQFSGQPSVAKDRIYAIDAGRLVVLDEVTHAVLWSWQPASGSLEGTMIVTDSHVLASTSDTIHAVDLATHQSAWSYPASGSLALADETLFVASSDGSLTAISVTPGSSFYTVTPCRIADTRNPVGPLGGPALPAGTTRAFQLTGSCGIPESATAVAANLTVTGPSLGGALRAFPTGGPTPDTTTLSFSANRARANNAILGLGAGGQVSIQCDMPDGSTDLIIDVVGYFQ
jgi:hypothetical protein